MEVVLMIGIYAIIVARKDIGPMNVKKAVGKTDATNAEKGDIQKKTALAQEALLVHQEEGEDQAQGLVPAQRMAIAQGGQREIDIIKTEAEVEAVIAVEVEVQREIAKEIRIQKRNIESEASPNRNQVQNLSLAQALQMKRKRRRVVTEILLKSSRSLLHTF
jgi:hypothetical protein